MALHCARGVAAMHALRPPLLHLDLKSHNYLVARRPMYSDKNEAWGRGSMRLLASVKENQNGSESIPSSPLSASHVPSSPISTPLPQLKQRESVSASSIGSSNSMPHTTTPSSSRSTSSSLTLGGAGPLATLPLEPATLALAASPEPTQRAAVRALEHTKYIVKAADMELSCHAGDAAVRIPDTHQVRYLLSSRRHPLSNKNMVFLSTNSGQHPSYYWEEWKSVKVVSQQHQMYMPWDVSSMNSSLVAYPLMMLLIHHSLLMIQILL
jgi:hypothetical protein